MSKWEQIKEIKGLLASLISFVTVLILAGGFVLSLVVDAKVRTALSKLDIGTDEKIVAMDTATAANTSGVAENKEDLGGLERRIEAAVAALMRRPMPSDDEP